MKFEGALLARPCQQDLVKCESIERQSNRRQHVMTKKELGQQAEPCSWDLVGENNLVVLIELEDDIKILQTNLKHPLLKTGHQAQILANKGDGKDVPFDLEAFLLDIHKPFYPDLDRENIKVHQLSGSIPPGMIEHLFQNEAKRYLLPSKYLEDPGLFIKNLDTLIGLNSYFGNPIKFGPPKDNVPIQVQEAVKAEVIPKPVEPNQQETGSDISKPNSNLGKPSCDGNCSQSSMRPSCDGNWPQSSMRPSRDGNCSQSSMRASRWYVADPTIPELGVNSLRTDPTIPSGTTGPWNQSTIGPNATICQGVSKEKEVNLEGFEESSYLSYSELDCGNLYFFYNEHNFQGYVITEMSKLPFPLYGREENAQNFEMMKILFPELSLVRGLNVFLTKKEIEVCQAQFNGVFNTREAFLETIENFVRSLKKDGDVNFKPDYHQIKEFVQNNYSFSKELTDRIRFTQIYETVCKLMYIDSEHQKFVKTVLPQILKELGLEKKRYTDGMYWYGMVLRQGVIIATSVEGVGNETLASVQEIFSTLRERYEPRTNRVNMSSIDVPVVEKRIPVPKKKKHLLIRKRLHSEPQPPLSRNVQPQPSENTEPQSSENLDPRSSGIEPIITDQATFSSFFGF